MGKLAVLAMQLHGVLTCTCDCVAKNVCLPLLAEIKPPQTTQNCGDNGKSSAVIRGTDLTQQVRYFPRQPRTPVLPQRPTDLRSTLYPTQWTVQWRHDGNGNGRHDGDALATRRQQQCDGDDRRRQLGGSAVAVATAVVAALQNDGSGGGSLAVEQQRQPG